MESSLFVLKIKQISTEYMELTHDDCKLPYYLYYSIETDEFVHFFAMFFDQKIQRENSDVGN